MQTCAQWIRSNLHEISDISDAEMNSTGLQPSDSVYVPLDRISSLVIHHSATETGCAKVFRALHRSVNGWVDIGYHFVIGNGTLSGDGEIESGRPVWSVGAHAREHNRDSIGICLVGNFNKTSPTEKQMASLTDLLKKLMADFRIPGSGIMIHKNVPGCNTECPGDNLTIKAILSMLP